MPLVDEIYGLKDTLANKGVIFCFSGYMTEDVLLSMGKTIKKKLNLVEADNKTSRSLFAVFVEEAQNIIRYSSEQLPHPDGADDEEKTLRHGFLSVGVEEGKYYVCCANVVKRADVSRLNDHLTHIQGLDSDGLKALFRQTLKGKTPKGSKGAGVGFIDIARRATRGFEFGFKDLDDSYSYFCLKAYV